MANYLVVYEQTKIGYSAYVANLAGVIAINEIVTIVEKTLLRQFNFI